MPGLLRISFTFIGFLFLITVVNGQEVSPAQSAATPGKNHIARISAYGAYLELQIAEPDHSQLRLLELRPYEHFTSGGVRRVAWQGPAKKSIRVIRRANDCDRLYSKFLLLDEKSGEVVDGPRYVDDFSHLSKRDFDFPWPDSPKGVTCPVYKEDVVDLGVNYINTNVSIFNVIDWKNNDPKAFWTVDGEKIPINLDYLNRLDEHIKFYSDAGINVTVVFASWIPGGVTNENPLVHPDTNIKEAPNHMGAFNLTDEEGYRYYRAAIECLAERYSKPDASYGWISGFIIGNELQAHWQWYNLGRMEPGKVVEQYERALRVAHTAVRRFHAKQRVYVSMDHHWTRAISPDPLKCLRGKFFLDRLNALVSAQGNYDWDVAFHPYPQNLFNPAFWKDSEATLSFDTPFITFKNLEVLPAYLKQERFLYRNEPRGIILSEQGFHAAPTPEGEQLQAAAYAAAYYKVSHMPEIDAFMLHRHVSSEHEGGLQLGLWSWPEETKGGGPKERRKLPIYDVFKKADTDQWREAFAFAKPIIGIDKWSELLPSDDIQTTATTQGE